MLVALLALGCGGAPIERPTTPAHGGVLVTLEDHLLELVVHASGEVQVFARSAGDLHDCGVTVTLRAQDGDARAVATRWRRWMFEGRLEEGTPRLGPAQVLLLDGGRRSRARVEVTRILPLPEHGGAMLWLAGAPVEVVVDAAGRAELHAPRMRGELTLGITGEDGQLHPLALGWDADRRLYTGTLEGMAPQPGPLEIVLSRGRSQWLARGALAEVARDPSVPSPDALQLELPELGSDLPSVIAVPPPE